MHLKQKNHTSTTSNEWIYFQTYSSSSRICCWINQDRRLWNPRTNALPQYFSKILDPRNLRTYLPPSRDKPHRHIPRIPLRLHSSHRYRILSSLKCLPLLSQAINSPSLEFSSLALPLRRLSLLAAAKSLLLPLHWESHWESQKPKRAQDRQGDIRVDVWHGQRIQCGKRRHWVKGWVVR